MLQKEGQLCWQRMARSLKAAETSLQFMEGNRFQLPLEHLQLCLNCVLPPVEFQPPQVEDLSSKWAGRRISLPFTASR